jgi:hypothetical protein
VTRAEGSFLIGKGLFAGRNRRRSGQPTRVASFAGIEKLKCGASAIAITFVMDGGQVEKTMNAANKSRLKLDISFIRGVWEVVIFIGNQTEHRSFRTEAEARAYGKARIEQIRQGKPKSKTDGATT